MKRLRLALLAMAALALGLIASAQAQPATKEHEVIKLERELTAGFRNNDFSAFERYTPSDYTTTNANGQIRTKQQALQDFKNANAKYEKFDVDDLAVRSYGDVAVVTGRSHSKGSANNRTTGQREEFDRQGRFTAVWTKISGRWMRIAFHSSNAPAKAQ